MITRTEESYRLWCVWVWEWSLDSYGTLAHWGGCCPMGGKTNKWPTWKFLSHRPAIAFHRYTEAAEKNNRCRHHIAATAPVTPTTSDVRFESLVVSWQELFYKWGSQPHSKPQTDGSGLHIYVPRDRRVQLYPRTPGIHFSRLLRQRRQRWGYSCSQPLHGKAEENNSYKFQIVSSTLPHMRRKVT